MHSIYMWAIPSLRLSMLCALIDTKAYVSSHVSLLAQLDTTQKCIQYKLV